MEEDFAKSAGEVVTSALAERKRVNSAGKRGGAKRAPARWELIKLSMKLSELSENWLVITVNVPDQMVLSSARFRKARLERGISAFFGGVPVAVDFRVGPIRPAAQPARSSPQKIYRRAPVVNGEEEIAERAKFFLGGGMSPDLAGAMARDKLSLEKLSKRRR